MHYIFKSIFQHMLMKHMHGFDYSMITPHRFFVFKVKERVCINSGFKLVIWNWEMFCSDFLVSGRSFKPGFTFVYMLYTFKLLPQLKIGRGLSL